MMGESDPQRSMFYKLSLESFVPADHPLRQIRPLIDDGAIRQTCRPLYSRIGRPSIPSEQLFLALVGEYLLGIGVEVFRSSASETEGCKALLKRARRKLRFFPKTLGADKGFFSEKMIEHLIDHGIQPHIATDRGKRRAHTRVRMRQRGEGYKLSQRCRKKIEELFGEAKDWHGMRRFRRRGLMRVREEALLIGWVLNLKRRAYALPPPEQPA
jgi:hypothetical protein